MTDPEHYASYDFGEDEGIAVYSRRCLNCGRWLQVPEVANMSIKDANKLKANCSRCGEVTLDFQGWF